MRRYKHGDIGFGDGPAEAVGSGGTFPYPEVDATSDLQYLVLSEGNAEPHAAPAGSMLHLASIASLVGIIAAYAAAFRHEPHVLYGLLCLIIGRFICTLVHEVGHAVTALACKWQIVAFVVRPFGWQISNSNFGLVPRRFRKGLGGWVATIPRRDSKHDQLKWLAILAAGPLASLLLALIAFAAISPLPAMSPDDAVSSKVVALALGLQSLHMGLFAILPATQPGVISDGQQWRALRKADGRYSFNRPIIWLATLLNNNVRPRALPGWLLTQAQNWSDSWEGAPAFLASLEIGRVLDAETVDVPRARFLIDRFRATYESSEWLAACDAYLAAVWEADVARAEAALAERAGSSATLPIFMAAEAAVAAQTGERALARSKLKEMLATRRRESPFRDHSIRDMCRQIELLLA